jgi:hypothetical protein
MAKYQTSDISANLDAQKMFSDLWWLNYCFCCGRGIGDIGNPLIGSEGKQLCLHSKCQMTNVGDPLCGGLSVFCCETTHFRLPPSADTPICVLCSKELVGKSGSGWKPELFDFKPAFGDQFWLVYMFCCGTALTAPGANGRPLIGSLQKVICVEQATRMVPPVEDGVVCGGIGTVLCCWDQCQLPPADNNPGCKCFGKLGKAQSGSVKPMSYGKPGQVEMS